MAPIFYDIVSAPVALLNSAPSAGRLFTALTALLGAQHAVTAPDADSLAPVAKPGYEIKLGLTEAALTGGVPSDAMQHAFNLDPNPSTRSYGYYDDEGQSLNEAGWAVRLRHKEDKDFELVYKKRFAITNGIEAALRLAKSEGFDSSDDNYDSEVDWMYSKQVLSFQLKKRREEGHYHGTSLPDSAEGRNWLLDELPGKLASWGGHKWGRHTMQHSRLHGPVTSNVYMGDWADTEVKIEVLPVRNEAGDGYETIVELSFAAQSLNEATRLRDKAISQLRAAGWLLDHDLLKTRIVLGRY
jgi:hypothetical protein